MHKPLKSIDEINSKFYCLIDVKDKAGVLAKIASIFGEMMCLSNQ